MKPVPSLFDEIDAEGDERADAQAMADIAAGRVVPHAEVEAWLETWGTPDETPAPAHWFK
ncbi:antitoxin [Phenylobacterium aquaticum]|uniref:antitoxin n=1 Tax=Phenylobacterium aquaticum TaxID=1763816 RepID=UPI001F5CA072|nr:antitoxin [Phenylobacterium aquaticum]MCI3133671.1 antitoxin [Phenylobacterium aquaticum]